MFASPAGVPYAAWNPKGGDRLFSPGIKILFFGKAQGCAAQAGPVAGRGVFGAANVPRLTGLRLAEREAKDAAASFHTPSAEVAHCQPAQRNKKGDSFVYLNPKAAGGTIALYTATGPEKDGAASFFEPFGQEGQTGSGANTHIEGTFVIHRVDPARADQLHPWAEGGMLEITSVQGVGQAKAGDGAGAKPGDVIQVKQQMDVTLINPACRRTTKESCQIQYLFNLAVFRAGVADWKTVPWARGANVFPDPAQGGMTIVDAFLGDPGSTGTDRKFGLPLYDSRALPTQHQPFNDGKFQVRIAAAQLLNGLRIAAANRLGKTAPAVSDGEMATLFGPRWDKTADWALLSATVGQEVHNPVPGVKAAIGGSLRSLSVDTVAPDEVAPQGARH